MKKVFSITYILFLLITVNYAKNVNGIKQHGSENIKMVISKYSVHNINSEVALATAQILANHIKKIKKIKNNFNIEIASNESEILEKHKYDFDIIILSIEEYFRLKKKIPLDPFFVNYTGKNYGYEYLLVVNKNDNIENISQLKGESIYIQAHNKEQVAFIWLNKLLKSVPQKDSASFFKNYLFDNNAVNVLLPVFFKKAKACIITNSSLELMTELNPSIKSQIRVLKRSEPILLGITCLNANKKDSDSYKLLKELMPILHETEYGKQLLDMFRTDKLILFKDEYLNGYYNLMK